MEQPADQRGNPFQRPPLVLAPAPPPARPQRGPRSAREEDGELLIEGVHRPGRPGHPFATPWDLPATGCFRECQLHGRPAERRREGPEWLRVLKSGKKNGIAAEHHGEAAQLMGLLNHNKVATIGRRAWVEQSKRRQQRCIRVCKLRPERRQVRHAYVAPAECRERYQVGRPHPRQSRPHHLHSPGQLEPHRATRTVPRRPLVKRPGHLRVLSGVAPLRINQQQQGIADATDVSPRRAITHHDLDRKRSVGCSTGEEIELLLAQPSLRIQTSTCGVIALLAGEHEPSAADRLRWHVLMGERGVAERLTPVNSQAARAGIVLTGRRQSVWPADCREVTA